MFDPYRKWLGIPKDQRPPTHYQLLGLAEGEDDADVIEEAAIRQTAHVRTYQIGPHAKDCTQILNEISKARTVLLNPAKKKEYDSQLAKKKAAEKPVEKPAEQVKATAPPPRPTAFDDLDDEPLVKAPSVSGRKKSLEPVPVIAKEGVFLSKGMLYGLIGGGAGFVAVIVLVVLLMSGGTPETEKQPVALAEQKGVPAPNKELRNADKGGMDPGLAPPIKDPPKDPPKVLPPIAKAPVVPPLAPRVGPGPIAGGIDEGLGEGELLIQVNNGPFALHFAPSPDGENLVFHDSGKIKKLHIPTKIVTPLGNAGVLPRAWSPDGAILAIQTNEVQNRKIVLADARTGDPLHELLHPALYVLRFSPDSKHVLTGSQHIRQGGEILEKPSMRLWEAATGKELLNLPHMHDVLTVGFLPNGDLWSIDGLSVFRRWDQRNGEKLEEFAVPLRGNLTQDGTCLVGYRDQLKRWDLQAKRDRNSSAPIKGVQRVHYTPDGRWLAGAAPAQSGRFRLFLWNSDTGVLRYSLSLPFIQDLKFAPDGKSVITSHLDRTIRRFQLDEAFFKGPVVKAPPQAFPPAEGVVRGIPVGGFTTLDRLVPDGPVDERGLPCKVFNIRASVTDAYQIDLMSVAFDAFLTVEDSTGKRIALDDDGGEGLNSRLTINLSSGALYRVVCTSFKGGQGPFTLRVRRASDVGAPLIKKDDPPAKKIRRSMLSETIYSDPRNVPIEAVAFSRDGQQIAFQSFSGIEIMNLKTKQRYVLTKDRGAKVLEFSPNGIILAVGTNVKSTRWYQVKTGALLRSTAERANALCFHANGTDILIGTLGEPVREDGRFLIVDGRPVYEDVLVRLMTFTTGKSKKTLEGHNGPVVAVAFAKDGSILSASRDRTLRRWDAKTGAEITKFHAGFIDQAFFTADGDKALITDSGGGVAVWDLESQKPLRQFRHSGSMRPACWSEDARTFLSFTRKAGGPNAEGDLILWDSDTGQRVYSASIPNVRSMAVSRDGRLALTGCDNGDLLLWTLSDYTHEE